MDVGEFWGSVLSDQRIHIEQLDFEDMVVLGIVLRRNINKGNYFISEWEHPLRESKLEYHLHTEEKGRQLRELYDQGRRSGNPSLVEVYSRSYIEDMYKARIVA